MTVREHTCPSPISVTEHSLPGWDITIFQEGIAPSGESFDRAMVDRRLKIATVSDGAVNTDDPNGPDKTRSALYVIDREVRLLGIEAGLSSAAAIIHDPNQPINRNGLATFAGVQLGDQVHAWCCGDSEVWVRRGTEWESLFPADMLTAEGRAVYQSTMATRGDRTGWSVQEETLEDLARWASPAVGLDSAIQPLRSVAGYVDEVVLSTDGALLNPARVIDLVQWLTVDIHVFPPGHPHQFAHGDLTVIRAVRHTEERPEPGTSTEGATDMGTDRTETTPGVYFGSSEIPREWDYDIPFEDWLQLPEYD